ncbi:MAG: c-type cytochrome, partial [Myxococcota bacterium]
VVVDAESLAAGKEVFETTCASCHNSDMSGGIGPSLVDAEWVHGAAPEQVQATITNGVIAKGMPAWGPVIGPEKVAQVAAYIVDTFEKTGLTPVAAAAAEEAAPVEAPAADADPLVAGEQLYTQYCVVCHGPSGEGTVTAPRLIDAEWLHGSELEQIMQVVSQGVEGKAMVAWEPVLGEAGVKQVATYVHHRANNPDE